MPSQTEAGKAFEYALLSEADKQLSKHTSITVLKDSSLEVAQAAFFLFLPQEQAKYRNAAHAAIQHVTEIEPRLSHPDSFEDKLTLQLVADSEGIKGDVRDLLFIRSGQNWEIGIFAKNNHKAVKHSRLSDKIDFGKEWLDLKYNESYFHTIFPIFKELRALKGEGRLWRDLQNKHQRFYIPILQAFQKELIRLDKEYLQIVPFRLLKFSLATKIFTRLLNVQIKQKL